MDARPLAPDDLPAVVEVVVAAFADYPYWRWLVTDADERAHTMRSYYRADLGPLLPTSWGIDDDEGGLRAVAVWARSDAWPGFGGDSTAVAGLAAPRMVRALAAMDATAPGEAHWYLDVLAARPADQGMGAGGKVLTAGLRRADADGLACYLETGKEANLDFYRHHGFAACGETTVEDLDGRWSDGPRTAGPGAATTGDGALHLWGMWRPPDVPAERDHL